MATKNNRRTVLTKRILKESLLELMAQKPISKISIKEICDLSDMSRSTFYLHYQDQFALLEDIEKEVLEKTFENLTNIDSEINTKESIGHFLEYVKDNRDTFGVLLCQPENVSFQNAIVDTVGSHIRASVPSFFGDERETYLYSFIMHGSLSVLVDWISNGYNLPVKDLAEVIYYSCNNIVNKF